MSWTYRRVGHTSAHWIRRVPVRGRIPAGETRSRGCDGQRRFAGHHLFRSVHHGHHTICGAGNVSDRAQRSCCDDGDARGLQRSSRLRVAGGRRVCRPRECRLPQLSSRVVWAPQSGFRESMKSFGRTRRALPVAHHYRKLPEKRRHFTVDRVYDTYVRTYVRSRDSDDDIIRRACRQRYRQCPAADFKNGFSYTVLLLSSNLL